MTAQGIVVYDREESEVRSSVVFLASALAVAPAPAAGAERGRDWLAFGSAEKSVLVYGTPETDDVVISFSCTRATREVTVAFTHEPVGAKDGLRIGMELFSEGGRMMLDATGQRVEFDDTFVLEAKTTLSPVLRHILTDGQTLSVMVQDGVEEIPLQGAAKAGAVLIEACG
jgi:hypothetical protein